MTLIVLVGAFILLSGCFVEICWQVPVLNPVKFAYRSELEMSIQYQFA